MFCGTCGQSVDSIASFCNRCGAPSGRANSRPATLAVPAAATGARLGVTILVVLLAACILFLILFLYFLPHLGGASSSERTKAAEQRAHEQSLFVAMTPQQHLEVARAALSPGAPLAAIVDGIRNARAIPSTVPEAAEAVLLEPKLVRAEREASVKAAKQAEEDRLAGLPPLKRAMEQTKLTNFTWRKEGFGSVMMADFTIRNDSPFDVKDLVIRCTDAAPSGTVIDHNTRTVYEIVKAHSTRTFRNVSMGFIQSQAQRSGCDILGLGVVQ